MAVIVDRASHAAQAVNRHSERRRTERRLARCREEMERTLTEYGRACFFDASDRESLRSQVAALTQEKDALTARLDALRGVIRCPECGAEMSAEDVYCRMCGRAVKGSEESAVRVVWLQGAGERNRPNDGETAPPTDGI